MNHEAKKMSLDEFRAELRKAIESELDIKVSKIRILPDVNDDGDQILEIKLTLTVNRRKWKPAARRPLAFSTS